MGPLPALLRHLRPDSALWRRAMAAGVTFGPDALVRYSPPLFGLAFGAALGQKRDIVRANLRRVLGRRPALVEAVDIARVFSSYASCLTEALLLGSGRGYELRPRMRGVEHYDAGAADGRGVILATAHTAGWEAAGPALSAVHPTDVVVVMQRERDPSARAIQDQARSRSGVRIVHVGETALDALPLLQHLRRRAAVAMQLDRVAPGMRTRGATLFGEPWELPEGIFTLAALSRAPILPVFTRRLAFMEYEVIVGPPIRLPRRPSEAELDAAAQALAGAMERFVRANPTQWFHFV